MATTSKHSHEDEGSAEPKSRKRSRAPKLGLPAWLTLKGRPTWQRVVAALICLYIVIAILYGILIYAVKPTGPLTDAVSAVVPYPAVTVNGLSGWVSYNDYLSETNSIKHYYEVSQHLNFTGTSGRAKLDAIKSQVLEQLTENALVTQLAAKDHVTVSDNDVNTEYNKIVSANGGQAKVEAVLQKYYLWNVPQFKDRIREQLLRQDLQTKVTSDPNYDPAAKAQAESILAQLKKGADFATLAKKYSQDSSAAQGGDLGWASKGAFVQPFENAAFALTQAGQLSPVIKTQFGYHIIKAIEAPKNGQVHVAQILIKQEDFNTWLAAQLKQAQVIRFVSVKAPKQPTTSAPASPSAAK